MPHPHHKFSPVRAARLSLLLTLSLTVGIGAAIYAPLDLKQAQVAGVAPGQFRQAQFRQTQPSPVASDAGQSAVNADSDPGDTSGQDSGVSAADQLSIFGSAAASSLRTVPQVVQTTQAPVLTTTQGS